MLKSKGIFFVCILIGVSIFSFSKSISLFRDKNLLSKQIKETLKPKLVELENENAKINDEIDKLQNSLLGIEEENKALKEELITKRNSLKQTQALLEDKEEELTKLAKKYNELNSENNLLEDKFNDMYADFIGMKKTLSSIEALKKAIRDLKISSKKNKTKKIISKKTKINKRDIQKQQVVIQDIEIYGNQGFLTKDGKSTYVPKLRIEVLSVEE